LVTAITAAGPQSLRHVAAFPQVAAVVVVVVVEVIKVVLILIIPVLCVIRVLPSAVVLALTVAVAVVVLPVSANPLPPTAIVVITPAKLHGAHHRQWRYCTLHYRLARGPNRLLLVLLLVLVHGHHLQGSPVSSSYSVVCLKRRHFGRWCHA
jgi:hypothetical protein